ncbi:putative clathrin assembly protein [Tanacetum coccineum]
MSKVATQEAKQSCNFKALKTLIVIHRALREDDPTFRKELLNFQQREHVLQLANFKDDITVPIVRLFLEERLECFKALKYDIESERIPKPTPGEDKGYSRMRDLDCEKSLEHLPSLQQLLYHLMGFRPLQSFLATVEEYIGETPRMVYVPGERLVL